MYLKLYKKFDSNPKNFCIPNNWCGGAVPARSFLPCCWKHLFSHPEKASQVKVLYLCVVWLLDMLSWQWGCSWSFMEEMTGMESHQGTAVIVTRPIRNSVALSRQIIKLVSVQIATDGPIACTKKFPKVQFGSWEKFQNLLALTFWFCVQWWSHSSRYRYICKLDDDVKC